MSDLEKENATLRRIAGELHWMARRYADGRQSVAAGLFNDLVAELLTLGVPLKSASIDGTIYARDGGGRIFDGLTEEQASEHTESSRGDWIVPERVKVCDKIAEILGSNEPDKAYRELLRLKAIEAKQCG